MFRTAALALFLALVIGSTHGQTAALPPTPTDPDIGQMLYPTSKTVVTVGGAITFEATVGNLSDPENSSLTANLYRLVRTGPYPWNVSYLNIAPLGNDFVVSNGNNYYTALLPKNLVPSNDYIVDITVKYPYPDEDGFRYSGTHSASFTIVAQPKIEIVFPQFPTVSSTITLIGTGFQAYNQVVIEETLFDPVTGPASASLYPVESAANGTQVSFELPQTLSGYSLQDDGSYEEYFVQPQAGKTYTVKLFNNLGGMDSATIALVSPFAHLDSMSGESYKSGDDVFEDITGWGIQNADVRLYNRKDSWSELILNGLTLDEDETGFGYRIPASFPGGKYYFAVEKNGFTYSTSGDFEIVREEQIKIVKFTGSTVVTTGSVNIYRLDLSGSFVSATAEWGDGAGYGFTNGSDSVQFQHAWSKAGTYELKFNIINGTTGAPLAVSITVTDPPAAMPLEVIATTSNPIAAEGSVVSASCLIKGGDGNYGISWSGDIVRNGAVQDAVTFSANLTPGTGLKTLLVTVTSGGKTATAEAKVFVQDPQPPQKIVPQVVAIADDIVVETRSEHSYDIATKGFAKMTVEWGDGSSDVPDKELPDKAFFSHSYAIAGSYNQTYKLVGEEGTTTFSRKIDVRDPIIVSEPEEPVLKAHAFTDKWKVPTIDLIPNTAFGKTGFSLEYKKPIVRYDRKTNTTSVRTWIDFVEILQGNLNHK